MFNRIKKLFQPDYAPELKPGAIKPVVLLVLDGYGIAPPSAGNAVTLAQKPTLDYIYRNFPHGQLIASGESVGLPANEEGNSEVGHLTIGVGRVVFQSLMRIRKSIEEGTFFENEALLNAANHTKSYNSTFHIIGLVGSGDVHSSIDHFWAMVEFAKRQQLPKVRLHLFTDGRDAPPKEGKSVIQKIEEQLVATPNIKIASVAGRYYAMDRDMRWERTQKAYEAMTTGNAPTAPSASQAIEVNYQKGNTDEFIEPTTIVENGTPVGLIKDNDASVFFNFRIDRPRQLTMAFTMENFEKIKGFKMEEDKEAHHMGRPTEREKEYSGNTFKRTVWPKNHYFVTMTEYQKQIPVSGICFPPITVADSAAHVIGGANLKHLHLAESEKERMVTFYFNGMNEGKLPGEEVIIVPSPKVSTYDKKPEMSTPEIVNKFIQELKRDVYHFFVLNFACTDMVAHTGNIEASIKAVEAADVGVKRMMDAVLAVGGTMIITADHGNVEELISYPTGSFYFTTAKGEVDTSHSNNPVPVYIINSSLHGKPVQLTQGSLSDIAPTILKIMNLPVPTGMTGKNLLEGVA